MRFALTPAEIDVCDFDAYLALERDNDDRSSSESIERLCEGYATSYDDLRVLRGIVDHELTHPGTDHAILNALRRRISIVL
jgi:hypothetical protein